MERAALPLAVAMMNIERLVIEAVRSTVVGDIIVVKIPDQERSSVSLQQSLYRLAGNGCTNRKHSNNYASHGLMMEAESGKAPGCQDSA